MSMNIQGQNIAGAALTIQFLGRAGTWAKPWSAMTPAEQQAEFNVLLEGCGTILAGTAFLAAATDLTGTAAGGRTSSSHQQAAADSVDGDETIEAGGDRPQAAQQQRMRNGRQPARTRATEPA